MGTLEEYYNKFNEDKRLNSRHGQVEFLTSMRYIHKYLKEISDRTGREKSRIRILDIGAGTGRYSIALAEEGYDVSAVELVKHNLGRLKAKSSLVKAYQGNALRLKRFEAEAFDMVLLFGPLYHLHGEAEKRQAFAEARRVLKTGGILLAAYIMNEFSVITYAFKERHIKEALKTGMLDESFHCTRTANELYSMVRLEDIDKLNEASGLKRIQIIAADGAANYMRPFLNALDEEEFNLFLKYHLATCERMDLMGASGHTVDILRKE
ncbi:MAG: class I SAM-dependent methyltransferase [Dorea sp.]|nr:class I SAM-dependent methyltransferase [Dorea sp.]